MFVLRDFGWDCWGSFVGVLRVLFSFSFSFSSLVFPLVYFQCT